MRPILKAGNIRNLHDARYCSAVGISQLGFRMGKESENSLSPQEVKEILAWLSGPEAIGEFQHEPPSEISTAAEISGIARISIPVDYKQEEAAGLPLPLLFRIEKKEQLPLLPKLLGSFPDAIFELNETFLAQITGTEKNQVLSRAIVIAENPEAVWTFAQKQGHLPLGFSLGNFVSDAGGAIQYENCDAFLEKWEAVMPA